MDLAAQRACFAVVEERLGALYKWLDGLGLDDCDEVDEDGGSFASRSGWSSLEIDAYECSREVLRRVMDLIRVFETPERFDDVEGVATRLVEECEALLDHVDAARSGREAPVVRYSSDREHDDVVWSDPGRPREIRSRPIRVARVSRRSRPRGRRQRRAAVVGRAPPRERPRRRSLTARRRP